ncbi:hypothetical protein Z951_26265 [Streptomyces sp. PRh5]|uniref:HAD family acid phosphatase n=1 Tax=Streptomyces sp. PRh5 TaxID=1158056 RepID=UPI0004454F3D|nr:HAD family acid phosphatase [Streptomyces sp. PRh5]EXU65275.1 hypothetical protein Z951_26265 [Streptomyces sp. PRh5]
MRSEHQALETDRARTTATGAPGAAAAVDYETWKSDVDKVIDQALPSTQQRIQNGGGQKQAIVLDIQRSLGDVLGDQAEYKTAKRAEIESLGYTIVANIGNNESDLVGGHASEPSFLLELS